MQWEILSSLNASYNFASLFRLQGLQGREHVYLYSLKQCVYGGIQVPKCNDNVKLYFYGAFNLVEDQVT